MTTNMSLVTSGEQDIKTTYSNVVPNLLSREKVPTFCIRILAFKLRSLVSKHCKVWGIK